MRVKRNNLNRILRLFSSDSLESDVESLKNFLFQKQSIVCITGAGISTGK
jgi:hypothetical protein